MHDSASYRRILAIAWPVVLANAAVPLLGLVDTAVIGNLGTVTDLGAIALGALVFNFVFWGFGFLRMGTTGFVARADGAGDEAELRAALGRALVLAGGIGLLLVLLQAPLAALALGLLSADAAVESLTAQYFAIRIWGAPAALANFAILGAFIGLARTRLVLVLQLFLNGSNIALDLLFAGVLQWGVAGIALGTAIAEWASLGLAVALALRMLRGRHQDREAFWPRSRILDLPKLRRTLAANADIMLRTLLLLACFAWFTNQGAAFGTVVLAANHILLQYISFSAYLLDGFAHAAEPLVGSAIGRGRRADFDRAAIRSTVLAALSAALLSVAILAFGASGIAVLTDLPAVRAMAGVYLPFAAAYVLLSFAAFQLDGIFIGASATRAMRNASLFSALVFLALAVPLAGAWGNAGLWLAFIAYVVARAVALGGYLPGLRARVAME